MKPITMRLLGAGLSSAPSAPAPAARFKNLLRVIFGIDLMYHRRWGSWKFHPSLLGALGVLGRLRSSRRAHARDATRRPCYISIVVTVITNRLEPQRFQTFAV